MITAFLLRQKVSAGFSLITLFSICLINSVVMSFSILLKAVSKFSASLSKKAYFSVWIFTSNSFIKFEKIVFICSDIEFSVIFNAFFNDNNLLYA